MSMQRFLLDYFAELLEPSTSYINEILESIRKPYTYKGTTNLWELKKYLNEILPLVDNGIYRTYLGLVKKGNIKMCERGSSFNMDKMLVKISKRNLPETNAIIATHELTHANIIKSKYDMFTYEVAPFVAEHRAQDALKETTEKKISWLERHFYITLITDLAKDKEMLQRITYPDYDGLAHYLGAVASPYLHEQIKNKDLTFKEVKGLSDKTVVKDFDKWGVNSKSLKKSVQKYIEKSGLVPQKTFQEK
jgi:hypothetical protein